MTMDHYHYTLWYISAVLTVIMVLLIIRGDW